MGRTLAEKVWDEHLVRPAPRGAVNRTSSTSTSTSSTR